MPGSSPNTWSTITPPRPLRYYVSQTIWDLMALLLALSFARTFCAPFVAGAIGASALGLFHESFAWCCKARLLSRAGLVLIGVSALVLAITRRLGDNLPANGAVVLFTLSSYMPVIANVAGLGTTFVTIGAVASLFRTSPWILEISCLLALVYCTSETSSRVYAFAWVAPLVPRGTLLAVTALLTFSYSLTDDSGDQTESVSMLTPSPPPFSERDEDLAGMSVALLPPAGSSEEPVGSSRRTPLAEPLARTCRSGATLSPPTRSQKLSGGDMSPLSFEALGLVVPTSLILLVESCLGRVTLISPPYRAPGWDDEAASVDLTLAVVCCSRLLAVLGGSLLTRHLGPKQAAMITCVWAAFICFGIALAFLSVTMTGGATPLDIKSSPCACLVYNAFFAFSSTCMLVPIILIFAGVCHERSERYKCGLVSRIVAGVYIVSGCGTFLMHTPIVGLLALFTTLYIIVLHLLRTRTPRIRWFDYDLAANLRAPGIHIQEPEERTGGATETRSVASRQGSSILANVERQTIANFV